ncbi:MAG TPA: glucose-6-phosphate isomerase, partial [Pirellulales bacterium]|nr:glucose-6-phosphate isomerase [Pirellulales bacterium]
MNASAKPLDDSPAWQALANHFREIGSLHLRELFAADAARGQRMALDAVGIYFDYSKNRATARTLELLMQLADEANLRGRIDAMFAGEKINVTEHRAVLHVALRAPRGA